MPAAILRSRSAFKSYAQLDAGRFFNDLWDRPSPDFIHCTPYEAMTHCIVGLKAYLTILQAMAYPLYGTLPASLPWLALRPFLFLTPRLFRFRRCTTCEASLGRGTWASYLVQFWWRLCFIPGATLLDWRRR
jgi:hypothetical protein